MAKTLTTWLEEQGVTREAFANRIGYSLSIVNKLCAPSVCHAPSMTLRDLVFVATKGEVDLVDLRRPRTVRRAPRRVRRAA